MAKIVSMKWVERLVVWFEVDELDTDDAIGDALERARLHVLTLEPGVFPYDLPGALARLRYEHTIVGGGKIGVVFAAELSEEYSPGK